ncbi:hybrid signal transduction histidine kinase M [Tanacetum coccineum]
MTLSETLQERLVVVDPQTTKEAWDHVAIIFHDKKRTRTIALKAELRSLKLGDLSIDAYFCKIESIATILTSLGSPISNDDVITFALEGFPDKYENVFDIIVHQERFLDLKIVHSMLTAEEMRLKSKSQALHIDSSSSSPMVLLANSELLTQLGYNKNRTLGQSSTSAGNAPNLHLVAFNTGTNGQAQRTSHIGTMLGQSGSNVPTGHETLLSDTFSAMTLQDPTMRAWNIDTRASSLCLGW